MNEREKREQFDGVIGRLDRVLSEFLCLHTAELDTPDQQTLKHHADDLIGVGNKMHELLSPPPVQKQSFLKPEDFAGKEPLIGNTRCL